MQINSSEITCQYFKMALSTIKQFNFVEWLIADNNYNNKFNGFYSIITTIVIGENIVL